MCLDIRHQFLLGFANVIGTAVALHEIYHPAGLAIREVQRLEYLSIGDAEGFSFLYEWTEGTMATGK